jgi:hypothetical protein
VLSHNLADDRSELEVKEIHIFFKVVQSRSAVRRFQRSC